MDDFDEVVDPTVGIPELDEEEELDLDDEELTEEDDEEEEEEADEM